MDSPRIVTQFYAVSQTVLGKGAFGTVYLGSRLIDGEEVAVKVIHHRNLNRDIVSSIENEVRALELLNHPNIIKYFDLFEDQESYQLCMELVRGGDLFDRIDKKISYTEKDAQYVCRTVLGALKHCHDLNVIHRDLKPENIMMRSFEDDGDIILVDFGLSVVSPDPVTGIIGTTEYMAPEIFSMQPYGKEVDMWSLGVVAYILLCGYQPFMGEKSMLIKRIRAGAFAFHEQYWVNMSPESKDFISSLLTTDVSKRMTATQALKHKWLSLQRLDTNLLSDAWKGIHKLNARRKIKAVFRAVVLTARWRKLFDTSNRPTEIDDIRIQAAVDGDSAEATASDAVSALTSSGSGTANFVAATSLLRSSSIVTFGMKEAAATAISPEQWQPSKELLKRMTNLVHTSSGGTTTRKPKLSARSMTNGFPIVSHPSSSLKMQAEATTVPSRLITPPLPATTRKSDKSARGGKSALQSAGSAAAATIVAKDNNSSMKGIRRTHKRFDSGQLTQSLQTLVSALEPSISEIESGLGLSSLSETEDEEKMAALRSQLEARRSTVASCRQTIMKLQ